MTRAVVFLALTIILALTVAACGSPSPSPVATPAATTAPVPSPTPAATPETAPTLAPTPATAPTRRPATEAPPVPTSVPTATTPPTPAGTPTAAPSTPTASPTPIATPAATAVPTSTPTPTPTPTPAPTPTEVQPDFQVEVSEATLQFPESISFHLEVDGQRPIETVDVEFGTNHVFSCASSSYWTARTDLEPNEDVSVTWEWDMRRRGSMPPGATIWWRWRVTDDLGQEFLTPRQETAFADERFDWQSHTDGNVTFYWYNGGDDLGLRIANGVRSGLETLELGKDLVAPITVFVYVSSQDVQGAVLFAQTWTGGLAFVQHNIILITVDPAEFERDLPGVVHELAHLLVEEVTFNCFGGLPTWLDEGLAVYAEGGLPKSQQIAIEEAIANDNLISLRSLNSSFPAGHSGAILSYALSYSLVDYLLDTHGWPKMQELLAVFSQGSTDEKAIQQVYGWGYDELEAAWRQYLGLASSSGG